MKKLQHGETINRVVDALLAHNLKNAPLINADDIIKMRRELFEEFGAEIDANINTGIEHGYSPEDQEKIILSVLLGE